MPKTILIIDDDESIREVTRSILEAIEGWTIRVADNGPAGVEMASAYPPDAILLDVMMPGQDGPETLHELEIRAQTRSVPVIFFTATARSEDVLRLKSMGARGVITKPYNPLTLGGNIAGLLGWNHDETRVN